jgi:hypothetical protein
MSRVSFVCGLLVLGAALTISQAQPKATAPAAPPAPPAKGENSAIAALKSEFQELPEMAADPAMKLGLVLKGLSARIEKEFKLRVQFSINVDAFERENVKEPSEIGIVADKPLLARKNITLDRYLRLILERVTEKGPVASGATYLIRRETIEITTNRDLRARIWGDHPGPFLALVHANIEQKPLEDALKELADQSEHNIVLDARIGDKAKTLVTARFTNLPLDSAVTFLADMADLQPILQDNAIYVTTRDAALRWESKQKKEMPDDSDTPRIGRIGAGVRGIIPSQAAPAAGMQ